MVCFDRCMFSMLSLFGVICGFQLSETAWGKRAVVGQGCAPTGLRLSLGSRALPSPRVSTMPRGSPHISPDSEVHVALRTTACRPGADRWTLPVPPLPLHSVGFSPQRWEHACPSIHLRACSQGQCFIYTFVLGRLGGHLLLHKTSLTFCRWPVSSLLSPPSLPFPPQPSLPLPGPRVLSWVYA